MNRPEIDSTSIRSEADELALTVWAGHGPTGFTFRATPDVLEALQGQIQDALAGKYDPPTCRVCHGLLTRAFPSFAREFWVHAVSGMDTHPPEPDIEAVGS